MARIRSIKPEFATDGDMKRLSDSCALFFILFWTQCDDEGKHKLDLEQICAELGGRWNKDKVRLFITCLVKSGQLRLSYDSGWVQVTGWFHQKIDKPKQPKIKAEELQWFNETDSTNALESSRLLGARIGSDRIDRIKDQGSTYSEVLDAPSPPKTTNFLVKQNSKANKATWDAYSEAYFARYQVAPTRNAKTNSCIANFVKRVGEGDAVEVIRFFVAHNEGFYIKASHSVALALRDAESLRTQWLRRKPVTQNDVRQFEKSDQLRSQLDRIERGEL